MKRNITDIKTELTEDLFKFIELLGIDTSDMNKESLTENFVKVITSYEQYKHSVISGVRPMLENVFNNLPPDIEERILNKIPKIEDLK